MKLANGSVFVGDLTTVGRKTGAPRTVEIRMVYLDGKFYAASGNVGKKHWCRNLIQNPEVEVRAAGELFSCRARRVEDETLRRRVLALRDSRPLPERAVFELAPAQ